ncbi:hypothetical protein CPAR01_09421 [Colletotrichum paranaense]|uniref:Uncharacterized protein n=1 Tax=Colletotrichum paranaense TaxID=1914294 RepID=A0ABQ9SGR0_9PEZI|nr:uncharacterized protein CPAR01_09421 [Colletotrichum paranaense]KAK1535879.1 hypothetical protein CPAR01_09421 [Colletotrichum paranaense]
MGRCFAFMFTDQKWEAKPSGRGYGVSFTFYFVWHFLFIRHTGSSHCPEGTMSEGHCYFYAFLLFMTLLDVFFLFIFSSCQLVPASTRVFGIEVGYIQFMGRQVICSPTCGW